MLELKSTNTLSFSFPEIHPLAKCSIQFVRTLRIPDDGKKYSLPAGLGYFSIKHTKDYESNIDDIMKSRGGVMIPMYQSEALYISFGKEYFYNRAIENYPFAIKIAAGKRSAVTGNEWNPNGLKEKDYIIIPDQPWIDGFVIKNGLIKQFIAAPLGMGFSVEEQLTNKAEFGGIQFEVYPMKASEFEKRFPIIERELLKSDIRSLGSFDFAPVLESSVVYRGGPSGQHTNKAKKVSSMGLGAGGTMEQKIYEDKYGIDCWETSVHDRVFVHLINSMSWKHITGEECPSLPLTSKDYANKNLPWFDYYSEKPGLDGSDNMQKIKTVSELEKEKGFQILPENDSVEVKKPAVQLGNKNKVTDGNW